MSDRFAWLTFPADETIDPEHPAWEQFEHERLLAEDPDEYARRDAEAKAERARNLAAKQPQPKAPMPARAAGVAVPSVALAVNREVAAELLSVSVDHFERHVLPHLRVVQLGRRQLVPVRELEDFLSARKAKALR